MSRQEITIQPSEHTLLVVEDNPNNLNVITSYLSELGFRILIARNGSSAFERARRAKPDMILLDILMPPGPDGFETCLLLKAEDETAGIPVIFMTALNDVEHRLKGFEVGAVDYVTKPIQQEELYARVTTHLKNQLLTSGLTQIVEQQTASLREAKELSEAAHQAKTRFINHVSHELRTPLTSLLLNSSILKYRLDKQQNPDQLTVHHKYLKIIEDNGLHLNMLIDELIDFSRLGIRDISLNLLPIRLQDLLDRVAENTLEKIADQPITFEIERANPSFPIIITDTKRLEFVLTELLENAIKFTNKGTVCLCVSRETDVEGAPIARFRVTDSGIGIDSAEFERIFLPFEQINPNNQSLSGVGLGLTSCQQIVQAFGSNITVESEVGAGSRFTFLLPNALPATQ